MKSRWVPMMALFLTFTGAAAADPYERSVHCEKNAGSGGVHWVVDLVDDTGNGRYILTASRNSRPVYGPFIRPLDLIREGRRATWKSRQRMVGLSIDGDGFGHFYTNTFGYNVTNLRCTGGGGGGEVPESAPESAVAEPPGKRLACRIADEGNRDPIPVPVGVVRGAQGRRIPVTRYEGHDVRVVWNRGSRPEPQTSIAMSVDEATTRVYNLDEKGIYMQHGRDYMLSCVFE